MSEKPVIVVPKPSVTANIVVTGNEEAPAYNKVIIGERGPVGPVGPQGPQGEPAPPHGYYEHHQEHRSTEWVIHHNLGVRPALSDSIDDSGESIEGLFGHLDENTAVLRFGAPLSGVAYLVS